MFEKLIEKLKKRLLTDMLIKVNYNQPKQIDGKKNICYYYEISEDTEIEIIDDLEATDSPVIYDVYWQNTDNTSELTFSFSGTQITLSGTTPDLNTQNHVVFIRHPKSTSTGIMSILEATNSVMGEKRVDVKI